MALFAERLVSIVFRGSRGSILMCLDFVDRDVICKQLRRKKGGGVKNVKSFINTEFSFCLEFGITSEQVMVN